MAGKIIIHEDPTSDALMFEVVERFKDGREEEVLRDISLHREVKRARDRLRKCVGVLRETMATGISEIRAENYRKHEHHFARWLDCAESILEATKEYDS